LQRCHWNEYVTVDELVHWPVVVVSVWPSCGVPETTGGAVFCGAYCAADALPEAAVPIVAKRATAAASAPVTAAVPRILRLIGSKLLYIGLRTSFVQNGAHLASV